MVVLPKTTMQFVRVIASVATDPNGEPLSWGLFFNPPRFRIKGKNGAKMRAGGYATNSPSHMAAKARLNEKKQYIENMYQTVKAERKARKMRR